MKKAYIQPQTKGVKINVSLPLMTSGDGSSTESLSEDEEGFGDLTYIRHSDSQFTTHNA